VKCQRHTLLLLLVCCFTVIATAIRVGEVLRAAVVARLVLGRADEATDVLLGDAVVAQQLCDLAWRDGARRRNVARRRRRRRRTGAGIDAALHVVRIALTARHRAGARRVVMAALRVASRGRDARATRAVRRARTRRRRRRDWRRRRTWLYDDGRRLRRRRRRAGRRTSDAALNICWLGTAT
jgi:hypothetical protein